MPTLTEMTKSQYEIDKLTLRIARLEDQSEHTVKRLTSRVERLEIEIELLHKRAGDPMECMRRFFEQHAKERREEEWLAPRRQ